MTYLCFDNLAKSYGQMQALKDVSLHLELGKVHALMGENGAGKSTLIKLVAAVEAADSLTLVRDNQQLMLKTPADAHNLGFRFIHQELNTVAHLSVAENIFLGRGYPQRWGFRVDWASLNARAQAALATLGAHHINPAALAGELAPGDQMLMKIAAALVADEGAQPCLYVFDEPTAALTSAESEALFRVIQQLKSDGAAVLYVSHRMDEVLRLCDDVTVLRDGRQVMTTRLAATSKDEIIHAMTGRDVKDACPARAQAVHSETLIRLEAASTAQLSGLNFSVAEGEIMGVAGLANAGQSELLQCFLGIEKITSGKFTFAGGPQPGSTAEAWQRDIAYVPRERRAESLMLGQSICANMLLPHFGDYGMLSNRREEMTSATRLAGSVRLKYEHPQQPVGQLSGGNQQKVVFARALLGKPRLLLLDEPTRGVDVGAKYDIYQLIREQSAAGCTVLIASSDLPELLGLCDRILVLNQGQQSHLLECADLDAAALLSYFYQTDPAQGAA